MPLKTIAARALAVTLLKNKWGKVNEIPVKRAANVTLEGKVALMLILFHKAVMSKTGHFGCGRFMNVCKLIELSAALTFSDLFVLHFIFELFCILLKGPVNGLH